MAILLVFVVRPNMTALDAERSTAVSGGCWPYPSYVLTVPSLHRHQFRSTWRCGVFVLVLKKFV